MLLPLSSYSDQHPLLCRHYRFFLSRFITYFCCNLTVKHLSSAGYFPILSIFHNPSNSKDVKGNCLEISTLSCSRPTYRLDHWYGPSLQAVWRVCDAGERKKIAGIRTSARLRHYHTRAPLCLCTLPKALPLKTILDHHMIRRFNGKCASKSTSAGTHTKAQSRLSQSLFPVSAG